MGEIELRTRPKFMRLLRLPKIIVTLWRIGSRANLSLSERVWIIRQSIKIIMTS